MDAAGNLFILQAGSVREVNHATDIITTIDNEGTNFPTAIALDSAGDLFIADTDANFVTNAGIVRELKHSTGLISTIAGNGNSIDSGDGGSALSAGIEDPEGLAFDQLGNLYVAEFEGGRVRQINLQTGIITTFAGKGTFGSSGDGGPATSATFGAEKITFDGAGNLLITDWAGGKIRSVNPATGIISTLAGGVYGSASNGDGGPASSAELSGPYGVAVDPAGNVYIADAPNNRLREVASPLCR